MFLLLTLQTPTGHIPAKNGLARLLSPFMLTYPSAKVRMETIAPRGQSANGWTLPIEITFYATPEAYNACRSLLSRADKLREVRGKLAPLTQEGKEAMYGKAPAPGGGGAAGQHHQPPPQSLLNIVTTTQNMLDQKNLEDLYSCGTYKYVQPILIWPTLC